MRKMLLLSFVFSFLLVFANEERCNAIIKVNNIEEFYKLLERESVKICGQEHCEMQVYKTTREVILGKNCDYLCSLYNEFGIDKMTGECEKTKPEFVSWVKNSFNEKDRILYAHIRLAPNVPCSIMVLDGPSKKFYYNPRTGEVFIEGDGKCPWGCGKEKPKKTK